MVDRTRQAGSLEVEVTPEMVEAGARFLREYCELPFYWSRGVAKAVFTAMAAEQRRSLAQGAQPSFQDLKSAG